MAGGAQIAKHPQVVEKQSASASILSLDWEENQKGIRKHSIRSYNGNTVINCLVLSLRNSSFKERDK